MNHTIVALLILLITGCVVRTIRNSKELARDADKTSFLAWLIVLIADIWIVYLAIKSIFSLIK